MSKLIAALALTALAGCATCNQHPTACAAITFVAVGAVTFAVHNHKADYTQHDFTTQPVNCKGSACL